MKGDNLPEKIKCDTPLFPKDWAFDRVQRWLQRPSPTSLQWHISDVDRASLFCLFVGNPKLDMLLGGYRDPTTEVT